MILCGLTTYFCWIIEFLIVKKVFLFEKSLNSSLERRVFLGRRQLGIFENWIVVDLKFENFFELRYWIALINVIVRCFWRGLTSFQNYEKFLSKLSWKKMFWGVSYILRQVRKSEKPFETRKAWKLDKHELFPEKYPFWSILNPILKPIFSKRQFWQVVISNIMGQTWKINRKGLEKNPNISRNKLFLFDKKKTFHSLNINPKKSYQHSSIILWVS